MITTQRSENRFRGRGNRNTPKLKLVGCEIATEQSQVWGQFDDISRRIDDLARKLNCLGYFDDDPDRPRAA